MSEHRAEVSWPVSDRPCEDCGSTERVRWYPDAECRGVHSCALCDSCTGSIGPEGEGWDIWGNEVESSVSL